MDAYGCNLHLKFGIGLVARGFSDCAILKCVLTLCTGVWSETDDAEYVNATARSPDGSLLVVGDDGGKVKLYRYPCAEPDAKCNEGVGHACHVTNVSFSSDGKRVFSIGGADRSILQWKVVDAHTDVVVDI